MISRFSPVWFLIFGITTPCVYAHPSVSVVMDSRSVVYYSDLENVWMILPDGTKQIAVRGVHTHELWIDSRDQLYGEDVTNVGEAYRHRVWVRSTDGAIKDVIPWRNGYPDDLADYAFVRDDEGQSYVLRRSKRRIDLRKEDRVTDSIRLDALEGFLHWTTLSPTGELFVGVGADVYRIADPKAAPVRVAHDLVETTEAFSFVHARHAIMGMWTDASGHLYVSIFSGQVVKRVAPGGQVTTVYRSEADWSPTGGLSAPDGSLWILEISSSNRVCVRRVAPDGRIHTF